MVNIGLFKTTDDLYNGVYLANMAEELVAEAFARARAFDETGDIKELDCGRHDFLRVRHLRQFRQA